ncbi:hypothetical protein RRG08_013655 [Elysia crispata]|uniref:Dynein heavy chain 3, axonemal n=1 Tax=Elysia crispata TaxID=231223 RepID=A0AAE1DRK1_9GAST|nr:hypothetical protein RRG08_013655 [Elysia crispata]
MPHKSSSQRFKGATFIAQPNEFELKYRPNSIKHLPPLSAPQPAYSDAPKILEQGSFTKSVPTKEKKYVRRVSDSIGNNYSPRARTFTTSHIYENTKLAYTVEETYFLAPRKSARTYSPPCTSRSLPDKSRRYSGTEVLVDGNSYRTLSEHGDVYPPILRPATPTLPPIKNKGAFACKDDAEDLQKDPSVFSEHDIASDYFDSEIDDRNNGYEADEDIPKNYMDNKGGWESRESLSYSQTTGSSSEADSGLVKTTTAGNSGIFIPEMKTVPEHETLDDDDDERQEGCSENHGASHRALSCPSHSPETLACLEITYPPWYFSTHGLSRPATPEPENKERYYQLAEIAIEPSMVGPITKDTLNGIYGFVPRQLRINHPLALKAFLKDMDTDYREAVRRAILNYVLLDPNEQLRLGLPMPEKPSNLAGRDGFPWHNSVNNAREFMTNDLFITHPVMREILYRFEHKYSNFRLIDIPCLRAAMPVTMEVFLKHVQHSSKAGAQLLEHRWLSDCSDLINDMRETVEAWMPSDTEARSNKMEHFFNSVASLMSGLLRRAVERSITDLVDLVEIYLQGNDYNSSYNILSGLALPTLVHPVTFFMEQNVEESTLQFRPSFPDICDYFSLIIDTMVVSVRRLPRLESNLFHSVEDLNQPATILSVEVDEELVETAKDKIRAVVLSNSHGPKKYREVYKRYAYLFKKETVMEVQKFINKDHPLREYVEAIEKLKTMASEINSLPVFVPMHFFLLDCSGFNQWLVDTARQLIGTMVQKIAEMSNKFNRQICKQYDNIVKKSSYQAENTRELVQLIDYVEGLKVGEMHSLLDKLEIALANMMFLMEYAYLPKEDIIVHNTTFTWPDRIIPIVRNAENKLQKEHDIACNRLKDWKKRFESTLKEYLKKIKDFNGKDRMSEADKYMAELEDIGQKIEEFQDEKLRINREEQMLGLETQTEYREIEEIALRKEPYDKLWSTAVTFHLAHDKWMNGPLLEVNAEDVEEGVQNLWRTAYKLTKVFGHPDFKGPMRASATIKAKLEKFKINMPLISALCNPGIKDRHWEMMSEKVGMDIMPKEDTPLFDVLQLGLEKFLDVLMGISSQASKEYALEKALKKMKDDWEGMQFQFVGYKDSGISILSSFDDIQVLLEDHIVKTMTMKGSPFIGPFEEEINKWDLMLHRMKATLDSWLRVQAAWLYLEPIFGSQDIRNQIPVEGKMFEEVDEHWRKIMLKSVENTKALIVVSQDAMLEKLQYSESMLDDIQKGLNNYLEKKRLFFPRFFFLSNDELLEILSETKDPLRVQPHLKKCFEGIECLTFTTQKFITAMESAERERVEFARTIVPADAHGLVERWLQQVEEVMKLSLREVMGKAVNAYPNIDREEWVLQWPGQIVLAASQIHWTAEVTQAIRYGGLRAYLARSNKQVEAIVAMVRGKLTKMARITLGALIVIDVHARDVINNLHSIGTASPHDFSWISQLRYYYEEAACNVRMITTMVAYAYEYLGNSGRLVITPLTDRCYSKGVSTRGDHSLGVSEIFPVNDFVCN